VGVDINKTWQNRKAAPVDLDRIPMIGRTSRADRGDRLLFDRQIDIAAINMRLRRLVPGDEPGGVADDFRGGSGSGMASPSKQIPRCSTNPAAPRHPIE
jgi:hypothetical protein